MDFEQINAQLTAISTQLNNLVQKQNEQDQVLKYLGQKVEITPPPLQSEEDVRVNRPIADIFRIPDPIKSMPTFDGNKKQVSSWLKTAQDTLSMFEPLVPPSQFAMYTQAVKNKIEGKARDILCLAGDPQTFIEVKQILLDTLGDKQELSYYKSQLWAHKQNDNTSIHDYHRKVKEIVQNIKTLAKQQEIYNNSWQAISTFIEEDALAAFLSGLKKPYFGYAQAAKPRNIEEAYAFLCKFSCNESIANHPKKTNQPMPQKPTQSNFQHRFISNPQKPTSPQFPKQNSIKNFTPSNAKPKWHADDQPTPMEVDVSMRSRNSFQRKNAIYTHETNEIPNNEYESDTPNEESSQSNLDLNANFLEERESDTES